MLEISILNKSKPIMATEEIILTQSDILNLLESKGYNKEDIHSIEVTGCDKIDELEEELAEYE